MEAPTDIPFQLVSQGYQDIWKELVIQRSPLCDHLTRLFHEPMLRFYMSRNTDKDCPLDEEIFLEQIKIGIVALALSFSPELAETILEDWGDISVRVALSTLSYAGQMGLFYGPFILSYKQSLAASIAQHIGNEDPAAVQDIVFRYLDINSTMFSDFSEQFKYHKPAIPH